MDEGTKFLAMFVGAGVGLVVLIFALSAVIEWRMRKLPPPSQRETKSEIKK